MIFLAGASLLGAFLFYAAMLYLNYPEPNKLGEKGMLYGLALVFYALCFFGCMTTVAVALNGLGRLEWVAKSAQMKFVVLSAFVITVSIAFFFSAVLRSENWESVPNWVSTVSRFHGMIWIPLLALMSALLLLVSGDKPSSMLAVPKFLAPVSMGVSVLFCSGLLVGWMRDVAEKQTRISEYHQKQQDEYLERSMQQIEAIEQEESIQPLFVLAGRFQDDIVREKALEKIKARENWEAELYKLLDNGNGCRDAYTFLDGNRVTDRKRFAEAVERSLLRSVPEIQNEVKNTNNMQDWSFEWYRIDCALRAIEFQFSDVGVDFVPVVKQLRSALNDNRPERFEKVKLKVSAEIDGWLRKYASR